MNFDQKVITQNGIYTASNDNLKGYHKLIVDVRETTGLPAEIQNEVVELQPLDEITDINGSIQYLFPDATTKLYNKTKPIPYIQSSGTQYFDTGLTLLTGYKVELDFKYLNTTNDRWIFGTSNFEAGIYSSAFYTGLGFTYNQTDCLARTTAIGTTTSDQILTSFLFARNHDSSVYYYPATAKLYSCKIYNAEDELIANYVPAISQEEGHENEVCLFDTVNSNYLYNAGSGTFIYGEDYNNSSQVNVADTIIPFTNIEYPQAQFEYKWLRGSEPQMYLESTGNGAYINTNIVPNQDYKIEMVFKHTNTKNNYEIPFGSRTSSTSNCFAYFQKHNGSMTAKTLSYNNGETVIYNMPQFYRTITKVTLHKGYLELQDENNYRDIARPLNNFTCTVPLTIFGTNTNGAVEYFIPMQLFSFKIWNDSEELVADFLPALSTEAGHVNEPCLFDNISNTYFYNAGSSNFTIGYDSFNYKTIEGQTDNEYTIATEDLNTTIKCKLKGYGNCEEQNLESFNVLIIEGDVN